MRKLVLVFVLGIAAFASQAQVKVGYADVDYIFSQMPESKQIDAELKSLQTQLKNQIDTKVQRFQKELQEYTAAVQNNSIPDAVRVNTERELQQQQQNIEKLQQDAQTNLQTKQQQLMEPVFKKVGSAIEETAKENGYTFVLSQQIGGLDVVLYADESADISDLVLKRLGVTPKPAAAQSTTTPAQNTTPQPATTPANQNAPKSGTKK